VKVAINGDHFIDPGRSVAFWGQSFSQFWQHEDSPREG
jgi:hypothetical protein